MNWFLTAFRTSLRRRIRARGTVLFLVLAVVLSLLAIVIPGTADTPVRVGIVLLVLGVVLLFTRKVVSNNG